MYFKQFTGKETVQYFLLTALIAGILWLLKIALGWFFPGFMSYFF